MSTLDDNPRLADALDLRALDPDRDANAAQQFLDSVMSRVAERGAPAPLPTDPLFGLGSLPRPLLIAASLATLAVLGAAANTARREGAQAPATIAEATGVPQSLLAARGASR